MELSEVNNNFASSPNVPQISITDSDSDQVVNTLDNEPDIAVLEPSFSQTLASLSPNDAFNNIEFPTIDLGNAVEVKNVSFGYNKNTSVLTNITLNVPKGRIYALLGSSGCGKTTLLRILLGRLKPTKGTVSVFGETPGSKSAHIPGPGVGYMPQSLALFTEFTIEETLIYFGHLYDMKSDLIEQRIRFLIEFLNLPDKHRKIAQLSGGQQRRTSIATTLFHSPPLLILDEPTVGVDPLLRCRIWEYLQSICDNEGMTVLITTHYIEESRNAETLGFMRFGRMIAQANPNKLLERYQVKALEDVFLQLCQEDCGEIKRRRSLKESKPAYNTSRRPTQFEIKALINPEINNPYDPNYRQKHIDFKRLNALLRKNYLKLKGNPLLVFFFLILPVIQITLFCESVVKQPDRLPVAIHSPELNGNLSDAFLDSLDPFMIKQEFHLTLDSAIDTVKRGKAWCAISMSANFSDAFEIRATEANEMTEEEVEDSKIKLYPDNSDTFIHEFLYQSFFDSYHKFLREYIASLGYNPATVSLPLDIQKPIYGKIEYSLINSIAPGAIVAIIYSTPLLLASFLIVLERKDGLLERSFVAGVRPVEVLIAHMITLILALIVQVTLLMFVAFVVFGVRLVGPVPEVFGLIFLQGLLGITFGLLVSAVASNEVVALLLAFGLVFPMWMICGVFWPLDSVPTGLKTIFYAAPLSLPIESMRYVITRGWNIFFFDVQIGYIVSALYNTVLFASTVVIFHLTSSS